ncbi:MAG: hypothetical protein GY951_15845, partial [Psychromonas sp.]|nr:hypothetical protein [Psychromonas sp.]
MQQGPISYYKSLKNLLLIIPSALFISSCSTQELKALTSITTKQDAKEYALEKGNEYKNAP